MRIAAYSNLYFTSPVRTVHSKLFSVMSDLAARLDLRFDYCHVGKNPPNGNYQPVLPDTMDCIEQMLANSGRDNAEEDAHLDLKTGDNGTTEGNFFLTLFGGNLSHNKIHNVYFPNSLRFYFPCSPDFIEEQLATVIEWLRHAGKELDACYAYINPVVMYDEFHPARERTEILRLLKENPVLDLWDDGNLWTHLVYNVKSPMWLTLLSEAHMQRIPELMATPQFGVERISDRLHQVRINLPFGYEPTEERLAAYRSLALALKPIHQLEFQPVAFRFPTMKDGHRWLQRFLSRDVPRPGWKRSMEQWMGFR